MNTVKFPLVAAALMALPFMPAAAFADETVETTTQQAPPPPGKRIINVEQFDLNKDGILSTAEVGEMLFQVFDTDTSGALEKPEYENKAMMTVVPMQKETTITYDFNNDGIPDHTRTAMQTFMQETQLARFDRNGDGLSPHEFIGLPFADVDTDRDGAIDLTEWRNAYSHLIAPAFITPAAGP